MKFDIKKKSIIGFIWDFSGTIFTRGINFFFFLLFAKFLSPREFGLLGIILTFTIFCQVFTDSGLSIALIKKKNCSNKDYNTVFYFNLLISVGLCFIFYLVAPLIAQFFSETSLIALIRFSTIIIVLEAFTIVQKTLLIKELNFKLETKITFVSNLISGAIALYLAYIGYGIWSLLWRLILLSGLKSIMLWTKNKWKPKRQFDFQSFKNLFDFGYKIFLSHAIANIFANIYNFVIGGYFSSAVLGYFSTAKTYSSVLPQTINTTLQKVVFSAYTNFQEDNDKLKKLSVRTTKSIMYMTFFVMTSLIVFADPLFSLLLDTKWKPFIFYFQVMCAGYLMLPLIPLNQIILMAKGRTDLILRTDVVKYLIQIPFIMLGILYGMEFLVYGFALFWWTSVIVCGWYNNKMIGYSVGRQILDVLPYLLISVLISIITYSTKYLSFIESNITLLIAQLVLAPILFISFNEVFKIKAYQDLKNDLMSILKK